MKLLTHLGLALVLGSLLVAPAASFTPIASPDAAYLASTTLIPVTDPDFATLGSLTDGTQTVTFSSTLQALTVPGSWATWSSPPFSETATPRVLWTQGATSVTLTLTQPSQIFGFEAQPNPFSTHDITADFFNAGGFIGSISTDVSGSSGARLFAAAHSPDGITQVRIYSQAGEFATADFAIAQLRYGDAAPVPEPATMVLVTGSLLGLLAKRRMRK